MLLEIEVQFEGAQVNHAIPNQCLLQNYIADNDFLASSAVSKFIRLGTSPLFY